MEELRQVAAAYYNAGTNEVPHLAFDFFKTMDHNKDGQEFLAFMRQEPTFSRMNNRYFFNELARDGNGSVSFWDVMTIYYIVKSGRPFCDGCGVFITGLYFACAKCFQTKGHTTFNLCFQCYKTGAIIHDHTNLVDNYTLLETMRNKAFADAEAAAIIQRRHQLTISELQTTSQSQAIVLANTRNTNAAFKALEYGLRAVTVASNLCSIL